MNGDQLAVLGIIYAGVIFVIAIIGLIVVGSQP